MPVYKKRSTMDADAVTMVFDHGSVSATTTSKMFKTRPGQNLRIDRVDYVNPTGLVAHASNYFDIELKQGSNSVAKWSTIAGGDGALAANTFVAPPMNATDGNAVAPAGTELSLVLTLHGTQTLPAGKMIVHARYL